MKLTKKHFEYFKKRVKYWQKKLYLNEWTITVKEENKNDNFLNAYEEAVWHNHEVKIKLLMISNEFVNKNINSQLDETAKHEVIHLILVKYEGLGKSRYIEARELNQELEVIVRKLTKLL